MSRLREVPIEELGVTFDELAELIDERRRERGDAAMEAEEDDLPAREASRGDRFRRVSVQDE